MGDAVFRYRPDILEQLLGHGVRPATSTRPELVHEFVSDLYRYEIRRLRGRLLAGAFPKTEYAGRVVQLRMKYPVIALRAREWLLQ